MLATVERKLLLEPFPPDIFDLETMTLLRSLVSTVSKLTQKL